MFRRKDGRIELQARFELRLRHRLRLRMRHGDEAEAPEGVVVAEVRIEDAVAGPEIFREFLNGSGGCDVSFERAPQGGDRVAQHESEDKKASPAWRWREASVC